MIHITSQLGMQTRMFSQTRSYQAQTQPWVTIGLGDNLNQPVEILITELNGQKHSRQFSTFNQIINWQLN